MGADALVTSSLEPRYHTREIPFSPPSSPSFPPPLLLILFSFPSQQDDALSLSLSTRALIPTPTMLDLNEKGVATKRVFVFGQTQGTQETSRRP